MERTFMSVERSLLQKAFIVAHRCGYDKADIGQKERRYFRSIAQDLWAACGDPKAMPTTLPENAREIGKMLDDVVSRGSSPQTAKEAEAAGRKAYEEATRD
jgi:hypothetical protein